MCEEHFNINLEKAESGGLMNPWLCDGSLGLVVGGGHQSFHVRKMKFPWKKLVFGLFSCLILRKIQWKEKMMPGKLSFSFFVQNDRKMKSSFSASLPIMWDP